MEEEIEGQDGRRTGRQEEDRRRTGRQEEDRRRTRDSRRTAGGGQDGGQEAYLPSAKQRK